jgi:hypothetical protein
MMAGGNVKNFILKNNTKLIYRTENKENIIKLNVYMNIPQK